MRSLLFIAVALAVLAAVAVATPLTVVSIRDAKAEIAERIGALVGGLVVLHGEPALTLLPSPGVVVKDVVVAGEARLEGPPLVRIPSLRASLRLLPLLAGEVEVRSVTLDRPQFHLGASGQFHALSSRVTDMPSGEASPGEVVVRDGIVRYESPRGARREEITAINLRLGWQRAGLPAALSGHFDWRGRRVEIDAELDDPRAVFGDSGSDGRATVIIEPAETEERKDGTTYRSAVAGAHPERTEASAQGEAATQGIVERLDIPLGPSRTFGPVHVEGTVKVEDGVLSLWDATFDVAGSAAVANLAMHSRHGRPTLHGSFAFDSLDLGRNAQAFMPRSVAELLAFPVSVGWVANADVDLWVSADRADIAHFQFTELAARLSASEGRARFSLLHAGLADGRIDAQATIEPAAEGVSVGLSGRLEDISVGSVGRSLRATLSDSLIGADRPPQGTGSARFELAGRGATVGAVMRSAEGWVRAEIEKGSLAGADIVATLEQVAARGNKAIASGKPFIPVGGRTQFDRLRVRADLAPAVARIEQIQISGELFELGLSGGSRLDGGEVEGQGVASLFASGSRDARAQPIVQLPFGVGGTLAEPVVAPGVPRIADHHRRHEDGAPSADADTSSGWCSVGHYLGAPFGLEPSCRTARNLADG